MTRTAPENWPACVEASSCVRSAATKTESADGCVAVVLGAEDSPAPHATQTRSVSPTTIGNRLARERYVLARRAALRGISTVFFIVSSSDFSERPLQGPRSPGASPAFTT